MDFAEKATIDPIEKFLKLNEISNHLCCFKITITFTFGYTRTVSKERG
jgi:hypothetical protein